MGSLLTYQQARGDRDDVDCSVAGRDLLVGFGNVAKDAAMDNGSKDEVNMANYDEC